MIGRGSRLFNWLSFASRRVSFIWGCLSFGYAAALVVIGLYLARLCKNWPDERLVFVFGGLALSSALGTMLVAYTWADDRWQQRLLATLAVFLVVPTFMVSVVGFLFVLLALILSGRGWTPFM